MLNKKINIRIKAFNVIVLFSSLSYSFPSFTNANGLSEFNNKNIDINIERYYNSKEKEILKQNDFINNEIRLLRKSKFIFEKSKFNSEESKLIGKVKKLLESHGDPQGFCPYEEKEIDRNKERNLSENMLDIISPIYVLPSNQKLSKFGEGSIWVPKLDISNTKIAKIEIDLLKELKPVFGYIYGDNENIYRGPISQEAALLIDELIDKILNIIDIKDTEILDKASYLAIKAANLYWPLGRINDSIIEYKKAINLLESSVENEVTISALAHLTGSVAWLYGENNDFASMEDYLDKSLENFSKLKVLDLQSLIETAKIPFWFDFHNKNINYDLLYKKYLSYLETIGGAESSSYIWAAHDYLWYFLPLKTKISISKSIVEKMRNCSKGYDLAKMLMQKAYFEFESGDYTSATQTSVESLAHFVYGNGLINDETAKILGLISDIKLKSADYENSIYILKEQINILNKLGFNNLYNPLEDSALGKIYHICSSKELRNCDGRPGIIFLKSLLDYLGSNFIYLSSSDRLELFNLIKEDIIYRPYNINKNLNDDFAFWLSTKGILSYIEKSTTTLINSNDDNKVFVDQLKNLNNQISNFNLNKELRIKLNKKRQQLERTLFKQIPLIKPKIITSNNLQEVLPDKAVLIEYQKYIKYDITRDDDNISNEERYLAFLITKNNEVKKFDLGSAVYIDEKIKNALTSTSQGLKDADKHWSEVRNIIIDPILSKINNTEEIFLSPDGFLNNVAFTALPNFKFFKKSYFGEEYKLRLLSAGRDLITIVNSPSHKSSDSLVIANPTYKVTTKSYDKTLLNQINLSNRDQLSKFNSNIKLYPLPFTEREGHSIAKILNVDLFSGSKANISVIKNSKGPKVLHIASHSFLSNQTEYKNSNPLMLSRVALYGAENLLDDIDDDGYLTAFEISQLDLNGTELVVISGCDSALGEFTLGEGLFGLKRAITIAGAKTSLLSLWKVDDEATAAFMESFYRKLKNGQGRSDALIDTQKDFRDMKISSNDPLVDWSKPYYWAAFQLSGDWRPIKDL